MVLPIKSGGVPYLVENTDRNRQWKLLLSMYPSLRLILSGHRKSKVTLNWNSQRARLQIANLWRTLFIRIGFPSHLLNALRSANSSAFNNRLPDPAQCRVCCFNAGSSVSSPELLWLCNELGETLLPGEESRLFLKGD